MKIEQINMPSILSVVDSLRIEANERLNSKKKAELGQYFTSAPICKFMASLFTNLSGDIKLLDPGAGVGSLSAAFTEESLNRGTVSTLNVTAYDIENIVLPFIKETFSLCDKESEGKGIGFEYTINNEDFILATTSYLTNNEIKMDGLYTHIIMNPPYKKINSNSEHRRKLSQIGIETVNLYSGFVALSIKLLKEGGELVAIIPRSFCNGPYYQSFREFFLKEMSISHIHIFDSRNNAFSDDDVLQENVIIHCVKGNKQKEVIITSSPQSDFSLDILSGEITATDMTIRRVNIESIVKPNDSQKFIHIAATDREQVIVDYMSCFNSALEDLDIEVSTGPVVDFRNIEDLRKDYETGSAPLIYPIHLNSVVNWPKDSKKPNAIMVSKKLNHHFGSIQDIMLLLVDLAVKRKNEELFQLIMILHCLVILLALKIN